MYNDVQHCLLPRSCNGNMCEMCGLFVGFSNTKMAMVGVDDSSIGLHADRSVGLV